MFCAASRTDWLPAGVTMDIVSRMLLMGLSRAMPPERSRSRTVARLLKGSGYRLFELRRRDTDATVCRHMWHQSNAGSGGDPDHLRVPGMGDQSFQLMVITNSRGW